MSWSTEGKCVRGRVEADAFHVVQSIDIHAPHIGCMRKCPDDLQHAWVLCFDGSRGQGRLAAFHLMMQIATRMERRKEEAMAANREALAAKAKPDDFTKRLFPPDAKSRRKDKKLLRIRCVIDGAYLNKRHARLGYSSMHGRLRSLPVNTRLRLLNQALTQNYCQIHAWWLSGRTTKEVQHMIDNPRRVDNVDGIELARMQAEGPAYLMRPRGELSCF